MTASQIIQEIGDLPPDEQANAAFHLTIESERQVAQPPGMAVSEAVSGKTGFETAGLREVVANGLQQFCDECDRFIQRQYQEIVKQEPSRERQEKHREELKWALRTAKLLECVASDPDSSSASAVALLRAKVWQLERSWKMLYDPMREEEADRILALHGGIGQRHSSGPSPLDQSADAVPYASFRSLSETGVETNNGAQAHLARIEVLTKCL